MTDVDINTLAYFDTKNNDHKSLITLTSRLVRSDEHHERGHPEQVSAGRLDQARLLPGATPT
jgi:hypothetical protein